MATVTIGRLSEEILKMLSGGSIQAATNISQNEIKISNYYIIHLYPWIFTKQRDYFRDSD